jgi:chorismate lyase/3-hydroxybenzoate synthase
LPPCFSRATRLEETAGTPSRLLVGGTASIRGETTLHLGDLEAQIEETFHNLASVVASGLRVDLPEVHLECECQALLRRFRQLRVYYPQERDKSTIEDLVRNAFSGLDEIELVSAGLCRDGLLVEIEGWADLSTTDP